MKTKPLIFSIILSTGFSFGQQVVSTQGDVYQNSSGSISFTIGEPVVAHVSDGSNSLLQGFQQPSWNFAGIDEFIPDFPVTLFPNPMKEQLTVQTEKFEHVQYVFRDASGKQLRSGTLEAVQTEIDVVDFTSGKYHLTLYHEGQPIKTIHLIKIN